MTPTLDKLCAIAQASAAGPWTVAEPGYGWDYFAAILNADGIVATCHIAALSREHSETAATARHIATFDPLTILAMLDDLVVKEARIARLEEALEPFARGPDGTSLRAVLADQPAEWEGDPGCP